MGRAIATRTWLSVALALAALGVLLVALFADTGGSGRARQVVTVVRYGGITRYAHVGPTGISPSPSRRARRRAAHRVVAVAGDPATEALQPVPATVAAEASLMRTNLVRVLGPITSTGTPRIVSSSCAGSSCTIAYRADERGSGIILARQALLWRQLFLDRRVKRITLAVVHASQNPDHARRIIFRETCDRAQLSRIDWRLPPDRGLLRYCSVISTLGGSGDAPQIPAGAGNGNGGGGGGGPPAGAGGPAGGGGRAGGGGAAPGQSAG